MNRLSTLGLIVFFICICIGLPCYAHEKTNGLNHSMIPDNAKEAVNSVERFNTAIAEGKIDIAALALDENVLILESGGAEYSAQEYLNGHAKADAEFLKGVTVTLTHRTAHSNGNITWIGSESEMRYQKEGKEITLLSTETMILKRIKKQWKIVHIHWSSRAKK
jgi:SnoaL-like domain